MGYKFIGLMVSAMAGLVVIGAAGAAGAQEQAGVTAAVRGQVTMLASVAASTSAVGRQMRSGQSIFLGDQIETLSESGMQAILLDETTFTMGPNSLITIDEFIYDPGTDGSMVATIAKGAFRYVTGAIAARNPSAVIIRLPVATVGIRGTIVGGFTDGRRAIVALFGPGPRNTTSDRFGRLVVFNGAGRVEITRPGFATVIEGPGVAPTPPKPITAEQLALLNTQPLPPPDTDTSISIASGRILSGEGTVRALSTALFEGQTQGFFAKANSGRLLTQAVSAVTTRPQLLSLGATIQFSQNNVPLSGGGFYDLNNLTVTLGTLMVSGSITVTGTIFGSGSGTFADFLTADPLSQSIKFFVSNPCIVGGKSCSFKATFLNAGGLTAKTLAHSLNIDNGAVTGSGMTDR